MTLWLGFISRFFRSCAICIEFLVLNVLGNICQLHSVLLMCLASLCVGAWVLLMTGLMGMFGLWVFIRALSRGALGYICVRNFCVILSIISGLFFMVFCTCFWNNVVESFWILVMLLFSRKLLTFSMHCSLSIRTSVLHLSAFIIVMLCCSSFLSSFISTIQVIHWK